MKKSQHFCVADIFLENEHKEILMIKRNGNRKILPNFYNGLGGKIEAGETPLQAVLREANEEAKIETAKNIKLKANLTVKDKFGVWQVYIFYGNILKNDVVIEEVEEGVLEWIPVDNIKNTNLVPDVLNWLPKMLNNLNLFQFIKVEYDNKYNLENIEIKSLN